MKGNKLCLYHMFFLMHISVAAITQQTNRDSVTREKATIASLIRYQNDVKENLHLFSGAEYLFEAKQSFGFPFWNADSLIIGSLYYDNNCYENIPLKYDLVNQKIVTSAYDNTALITLNNQKVKSFSINRHDFFWIDNKKYKNLPNSGFYDRLYLGKMVVWANRSKELKLSLNAEDQTGKFKEFDQYYIQIGNVFNLITNKNEIVKGLRDNREIIEKFIKGNRLNFKNDIEADLIKVAHYYDQLKN